jgi:SAM-dependent methyltransferase
MKIEEIDWNRVCSAMKREKAFTGANSDYWNRRAPSFARNRSGSDYAERLLRLIRLRPNWTVLDVGCAAGTLAIPLASRVRKVTAMDISEKMLSLLDEKCSHLGITNVCALKTGWEDDWNAAGIGEHDVSIASRSLITDDYQSAIAKLDKAARRRVYISTFVGDGPHDRRIYEAVGRELNTGPDYIYIVNLLYQMGICANVNFIPSKINNSYESPDELIEILRIRFGDMSQSEEAALSAYLGKHLIRRNGGWEMSYRRNIQWAVIWWDKR